MVERHILPITVDAAKMGWKRLMKRAGLVDLRFHGLRHEAVASQNVRLRPDEDIDGCPFTRNLLPSAGGELRGT
jgi:integrase